MSRSAIAERPSFYGGFHTLYEVYATVSCVRYAMCVAVPVSICGLVVHKHIH